MGKSAVNVTRLGFLHLLCVEKWRVAVFFLPQMFVTFLAVAEWPGS